VALCNYTRDESSASKHLRRSVTARPLHSTVSNLSRLRSRHGKGQPHMGRSAVRQCHCGAKGKGGWLCFRCLRNPGPPQTARRVRDTTMSQLNFKMRHKSAMARISWSRRAASHTLSSVRRDKSRPVGSDTAGRGALGRVLTVMKMLDKTEQSDRTPNPNEKPESCYCSALPKGSGPCLPCYTRWLAGVPLPSSPAGSDCRAQLARPTAMSAANDV
jgi:hypothetical protein